MCSKYFVCLIFLVAGEYRNFLTMKISRIKIVYNKHWCTCRQSVHQFLLTRTPDKPIEKRKITRGVAKVLDRRKISISSRGKNMVITNTAWLKYHNTQQGWIFITKINILQDIDTFVRKISEFLIWMYSLDSRQTTRDLVSLKCHLNVMCLKFS